MWASGFGNVRRVTELLQTGAPINWSTSDGYDRTALHGACYYNRAAVVKVLLKHNPLINQQDCLGETPLHFACWKGSTDCLKLLLATGQCHPG